MTFDVAADAYERYVGRYSHELAPRFMAFAGLQGLAAGPVLDVGCGPGILAEALAARFGPAGVAAIDTSEPFVAACRERLPGADVRVASAEHLPFADRSFAAALSQLVLSFVPDADRAAGEMRRVVRPGGVVAACTFEENGLAFVRMLWEAARRFDPGAPDDARLRLRRMAELVSLWERAGLDDVEAAVIEIEAGYVDFDDLWSPFAFGIGPAGAYLTAQGEERRSAIREAYREILAPPRGPFSLPARVIAVRGHVR